MAGVDLDANAFGSGARVSIRAVPPPVWVAIVAILGIGVLAWHAYRITPDDVSWLDPQQPPDNLPVALTLPGVATWGTPAMRGRQKFKALFWPDADHTEGAWTQIPTTGRPHAAGWAGTS